jgi:hypothetical protein
MSSLQEITALTESMHVYAQQQDWVNVAKIFAKRQTLLQALSKQLNPQQIKALLAKDVQIVEQINLGKTNLEKSIAEIKKGKKAKQQYENFK